ncbi:hypothetical protein D3C75_960000 [compost metagenome]
MVQPNHEAQDRDRARCVDHRVVAEQFLAGEGRDDFGEDTERWQDQDVHLRVTPCPEQVHVHHRIATKFIGENVEIHVTVKRQQCQGSGQDRERSHDQDVGPGAGPGEDRHVHQLHARGTHFQHGGQEVDPRQRRTQAG